MAAQPERIAALEKFETSHTKVFWLVVSAATIWLVGLSVMLSTMRGDIQAIKQKMADGGLGNIVSSLEHPKSSQQLAANLSLISSKVRVEREERRGERRRLRTLLS